MSEEIETYRRISMQEEVYTAIELIKMGLCDMENIDAENDFYFPMALLLSNGFERFMKSIYCYYILEKEYDFPSVDKLKCLGHDLIGLKKQMITVCISKSTCEKRPAMKQDYYYIKNDESLNEFIEVLSIFSDKEGRYYNLNVACGKKERSKSPKDLFDNFERYLIDENEDLGDLFREMQTDKLIKKIYSCHTKIIVEKFVRGLCRQFTLGELGSEAKKCLPYIEDFLYLRDSNLGKTIYCRSD